MSEKQQEIIVFGGGCFWCTEAVFKIIKGVVSVEPGYAGGTMPHPTYEKVSLGETGHAEVVRIEYDPAETSFENLLTVFFGSHDPTTPNRQGADVGEQYRSAVYYTTKKQREATEKFIAEINASSQKGKPVLTEVKPLHVFYPAEEYHKNYYAKHPENTYCRVVINPKLEKVKKQFTALLKNV